MSMKKTIDFSSKAEQNTWFNSKVSKTVTNVAFNKLQNLLHIPMDYGEALEYTYVRFKNLDSSKRTYYYFIHSCTLIDDTTVAFQLTLDPIQSFMCEWSIGECMVNRKHCDRWSKTSTKPIRITPNNEGITSFNRISSARDFIDKIYLDMEDGSVKTCVMFDIFIGITPSTTNSNFYENYIVPILVDYETGEIQEIYISSFNYSEPTTQYKGNSIYNVYDGSYFVKMGVDIERVMFITVIPFDFLGFEVKRVHVSYDIPDGGHVDEYRTVVVQNNKVYLNTNDHINGYFRIESSAKLSKEINTYIPTPTKPTSGISKPDYEPPLYMEPYRFAGMATANGQSVNFPDICVDGSHSKITLTLSLSASNQSIMIYAGSEFTSFDNDLSHILASAREGLFYEIKLDTFDIFSNNWLTYSLTQKSIDRQILSNDIINKSISNALFMGYGGALVGSRGGGLTNVKGIGSAVVPAVGLATAASVAGSVVDAHFAWENQKLQERKIQNQAQTVLSSGNNGYFNTILGINMISLVYMKCDDVNFNKAYENFRKYGYEINEWQIPNIRSRKYYDYILTNGAIINGSLNQQIKEEIANIFDSGITIFHADYSTTLDYPENENIERTLM